MIATLIILAGMTARYLQGNGFAGPGRWIMLQVMLAAGWFGPLNGMHTSALETACIAILAIFGWANIAFGYTKWEDIPYSLPRYTLPLLLGFGSTAMLTELPLPLWYLLVGPALALNYFFIAQHKPFWLSDLTKKDIAAPIAGGLAASLVFL